MKRYLITAALAFGVLASCTKTEISAGREYPLTFSAYARHTVKGYVTGSILYETATAALHEDAPEAAPRDIWLSAYIYPQVKGQSQTHFRGEKFSYVSSKGHWSHEPAYYWPLGAKMDFLAVSSSSAFPEEDIEWRATNGADQVRLVVRGTRTQDDILFASSYHQTNESASVPLLFKHSQAWIELRLYVSEEDFDGQFRVTDVTLEDVYTAGELTITNNDGGARATWDFRRATREDTPFDDPYGIVGGYLGEGTSYMDMLLPEQEKKDIVIRYTLAEGGDEQTVRCVLPHSYWLQGCKYVYLIDFAPQEVLVTAGLVEWDDMTADETDIK